MCELSSPTGRGGDPRACRCHGHPLGALNPNPLSEEMCVEHFHRPFLREAVRTRGSRGLPASGFAAARSEEHTSELQSLMRISYAVFCLKKKNNKKTTEHEYTKCT